MRFRQVFMTWGSIFVIVLLMLMDPDFGIIQHLQVGGKAIADLLILLKSIMYVGVLHLSRKALFDYPECDFRKIAAMAIKTPEGAGKLSIGLGLAMIAVSIVIFAASH